MRSRALPILAVGWTVFLINAYPGVLSVEGVDQLDAVHHLALRHAASPVMVLLWWLLDRFITGPFLLLVIQSGTLLAGAYLLLRPVMKDHVAALLASAVLLVPPVSAVMSMIWPESLMAGLVLLAAGLAFSDHRRAAILLALLAIAIYPPAIVATLPILVLALGRRGLLAWLVIAVVAIGANALITHRAPLSLGHDAVVAHEMQPHDRLVAAGVPTGTSKLQSALGEALVATADSPLGTPWPYLALALVLLVCMRRSREACALIGSGLAMQELAFALGGGTEPRHAQWLIVCVLVALLRTPQRGTVSH